MTANNNRNSNKTNGPAERDKNDFVEPAEHAGDKTASDSDKAAAQNESDTNARAVADATEAAEARQKERGDDFPDGVATLKTVPNASDLDDREVFRNGSQHEIDEAIEAARGVWTAQSEFPLAEYRDVPGDGTVVAPHELPTHEGLEDAGVNTDLQKSVFLANVKVGEPV